MHGLLLDPALTGGDDGRICYLSDREEVLAQVKKDEYGFFLSPTKVEQVLEMARAGLIMPQKSTYFYPKAPTGLVMAKLGPEEQAL